MGEHDIDDATASYRLIEATTIRARDPYLTIEPRWVLRRLSPETRKIEIAELEDFEDWSKLLTSMGAELAQIHAGSALSTASLLHWLARHGEELLVDASMAAAEKITALSPQR